MADGDRERLCAAAAVAVPLLALIATAPFGAHPVNDDWQMYWSAFRFATEGDVRVPDYSAMGAVGWTVPAGAVAAIAGQSFVLMRALTMATLAVAGWAAWRLAREFGIRPAAALGVSLAITLSPILFWLSTTFMTDAPFHALWLLSLLCLSRGLRTGRTGEFALGAAAAVWAAWIRLPIAAVPLALIAAAWLARGDAATRRRAVFAAVAALLAGVGGFLAWYLFVHGPTAAFREKSGLDVVRMAHAVPSGAFACVAYAGFLLLPLAPAALARSRDGRRGAAIAAGVAAAVALVHAKTGFLGAIHKSMPYLPNVAFNLGLGPVTLTDVYREGGAPPVTAPAAVQVALGVAFAALGAALAWLALRRAVAAVRFRDARVVLLAGAVVLYLGAAILFTKDDAPLFDRYLVPMAAPLAVLLLAPRGAGDDAPLPGRVRIAGAVLLAGVAAFAVLGTRDHHRFNDARFDLAGEAVRRAGSTRRVDGGFEFNCWHDFEAWRRGDFVRAPGWKGWYVEDPEFVVASRERPGYDVVDRRRLFAVVGLRRWDLLLLRRRP
jgi:4-amino-4-deoxy-L-arabinose transferase-like glycosyltransferase